MIRVPSASGKHLVVVTTSYPSDEDDVAGHFVRADVRQRLARGDRVTVIAPSARRTRSDHGERVIGIGHAGAFGSPGVLARLGYHPTRWVGVGSFLLHARRTLFAQRGLTEVASHFLLPSYWPIAAGHPHLTRVVVHGSDLRLLERLPGVVRGQVLARLKKDNPVVQCVSQALADRLRVLTEGQLRYVVEPMPIDLPPLAGKREIRQRLGVLDDHPLILVVARLIPSKRVDVALRAALLVPDAQIVVCGNGPLYASLTRDYPSVRFLGQLPRERTLCWMRAADVLLSASRIEGAPTAIREARALGVPVVTTAAGDLLQWAASDPGLHVVP